MAELRLCAVGSATTGNLCWRPCWEGRCGNGGRRAVPAWLWGPQPGWGHGAGEVGAQPCGGQHGDHLRSAPPRGVWQAIRAVAAQRL